MHLQQPHLQELLTSGDFFTVDAGYGKELNEALHALPWRLTRLNWPAIAGHQSISRVDLAPAQEFAAICERTEFGKFAYAICLFCPGEPLLGGRTQAIIENLDLIFWRTPGTRFVFAAEYVDSVIKPVGSTFLEYGEVNVLYFSR